MRVYLVMFLFTLLFQLIPASTEKGYRWRVFFTFLPMFLFGALRVDFGLDYDAYEEVFYWAHRWNNLRDVSERLELGFLLLNRIIPSWRLFLVITSALTCISFALVFYRCVPPKASWLAVCLLFLAGDKCVFFQFSGIRNAIAISIMMLGFTMIRDRKWLPFLFLTILAMQFHTSAVLFMPLAFFFGLNKSMSKQEATIWIGVMLLLQIISLNYLFENITHFIGQYLDKYNSYAINAEKLGDTRSFLVRFSIAVFVISLVWFMRTSNLNANENTVCRLALLYAMAGLLGALQMRMIQCYGLFFVFGSTILINKWKEKDTKFGYTVLLLLYLSYGFFIVFMQNKYFSYQIYHSVFG